MIGQKTLQREIKWIHAGIELISLNEQTVWYVNRTLGPDVLDAPLSAILIEIRQAKIFFWTLVTLFISFFGFVLYEIAKIWMIANGH